MLWVLSGLALLVKAYIKRSCLVAVSCQAIIYRIKPTAFQTLRQRKMFVQLLQSHLVLKIQFPMDVFYLPILKKHAPVMSEFLLQG